MLLKEEVEQKVEEVEEEVAKVDEYEAVGLVVEGTETREAPGALEPPVLGNLPAR